MSSPPPGSWSAPDVPVLVRRRAALLGASGRAWLAGLEDTLAELERRWCPTRVMLGTGDSVGCRNRLEFCWRMNSVCAIPGGGKRRPECGERELDGRRSSDRAWRWCDATRAPSDLARRIAPGTSTVRKSDGEENGN